MKKRMVAACLVSVLILSPGCYYTTEAYERRMPHSRRIAESRRAMTDAERGKLYKGIGGVAAGSGLVLFCFYSLHEMGAPEEAKENVKGSLYAGLGLLAVGGLLWLHGDGIVCRDFGRTKLSIAPNGCLLTCRF